MNHNLLIFNIQFLYQCKDLSTLNSNYFPLNFCVKILLAFINNVYSNFPYIYIFCPLLFFSSFLCGWNKHTYVVFCVYKYCFSLFCSRSLSLPLSFPTFLSSFSLRTSFSISFCVAFLLLNSFFSLIFLYLTLIWMVFLLHIEFWVSSYFFSTLKYHSILNSLSLFLFRR